LQQLGKLRRCAGKLRDVDVQLAILEKLNSPDNVSHEKVTIGEFTSDRDLLQNHLRSRREKRLLQLRATASKELDKGLRKRMNRVVDSIVELHAGIEIDAHSAAEAARIRFLALAQHMPTDELHLHEFRIACKSLRYGLEPLVEAEAQAVYKPIKSALDAIGDWHDWLTLRDLGARKLPSADVPLNVFLRSETDKWYAAALRTVRSVRGELSTPARDSARTHARRPSTAKQSNDEAIAG
jgi:CHAD domain-containing protein